ncbi:MAG: class I SAM-dependent methyltransferase [Syntrophus sp. (in: bacteria)]
MNKSWIYKQTDLNVAQFDKAMETYYPESRAFIHDPREHVARICDQCNYLDAIKLIDWKAYIRHDCSIMDLGCGGGWLSGYLSKSESVSVIYALDSSKHYLFELMPQVVKFMEGRQEKIVPIEGLFMPLLFQDGFLDIVVASSVLHHADSLDGVLKEIRRTLKKDGLLFVLNETPSSRFGHMFLLAKAVIKIFFNVLLRNYKPISQSVSSSGYLYDPYLGDRDYPLWYWKKAIERSGFSIIEYVDTRLPTMKKGKGTRLVHLICKAV